MCTVNHTRTTTSVLLCKHRESISIITTHRAPCYVKYQNSGLCAWNGFSGMPFVCACVCVCREEHARISNFKEKRTPSTFSMVLSVELRKVCTHGDECSANYRCVYHILITNFTRDGLRTIEAPTAANTKVLSRTHHAGCMLCVCVCAGLSLHIMVRFENVRIQFDLIHALLWYYCESARPTPHKSNGWLDKRRHRTKRKTHHISDTRYTQFILHIFLSDMCVNIINKRFVIWSGVCSCFGWFFFWAESCGGFFVKKCRPAFIWWHIRNYIFKPSVRRSSLT